MKTRSMQCAGVLRQVLNDGRIDELGEESGFARRHRKLTPLRAAWTFLSGMGSGKADSIADLQRLFVDLSGESIEYKAFHDRLSTPGFPEFFRRILVEALSRFLVPVLAARKGRLRRFEDIVVQDGSSFAINDALAGVFPGRFTKHSPAALEIHCTYSLFRGQPVAITLAPDKEGERQFLPKAQDVAKKLLLVDRGYVSYSYFSSVREAGGDFIGRVPEKPLNPRIVRCHRGLANKAAAVGKRVSEIELPRNNVDLLVEGKDANGRSHQFRLVLFYVRRKDVHLRLLTSLSPAEFRPGLVASLYRLRWQVELLFKECKSYTQLKKFQTRDRHIVVGLIWASLLSVLVRRFLLYCAFKRTGDMVAPFIAAAMSWTFIRDLAKAAVRRLRSFHNHVRCVLDTLRNMAKRTNPHRKSTFDLLDIVPITGIR